jgi:hypothetical protein
VNPRDAGSTRAADAGRARTFGGRELAFIVAWAWALAGLVVLAATGAVAETRGAAPATVLAGGIVLFAFVGAPALAAEIRSSAARGTTARALTLAALSGALALPALVAATLASPSASGTVVCGAVLMMLSAHALIRTALLAGDAYAGVAVGWLGGPPFVYYLLRDVLERRVDWVLALGPASGGAWTLMGPGAGRRFWWAAFVLAAVGAALTLVDGRDARGTALAGAAN